MHGLWIREFVELGLEGFFNSTTERVPIKFPIMGMFYLNFDRKWAILHKKKTSSGRYLGLIYFFHVKINRHSSDTIYTCMNFFVSVPILKARGTYLFGCPKCSFSGRKGNTCREMWLTWQETLLPQSSMGVLKFFHVLGSAFHTTSAPWKYYLKILWTPSESLNSLLIVV